MAGHSNPLTPLRYPGGKAAFAPFVKSVIDANGVKGGHYLEPFAGGAAVALDLLFNDYCSHIHINDLDPAIYSFWNSIVNHSEDFLAKLDDTPINIDEWHRQQNVLMNGDLHSELDLGFAAFFLNRTNRSGILKAGVIGGKDQSGNYKIDARFKKDKLINRLSRIADNASKISVYNLDAVDLLIMAAEFLPANSFMYLDPPYYRKAKGLYRNFYNHNDHLKIKDVLSSIELKWVVSYDNCKEIREIYGDFLQDEYVLDYCAHKKTKGLEIIIYGNGVIEPKKMEVR